MEESQDQDQQGSCLQLGSGIPPPPNAVLWFFSRRRIPHHPWPISLTPLTHHTYLYALVIRTLRKPAHPWEQELDHLREKCLWWGYSLRGIQNTCVRGGAGTFLESRGVPFPPLSPGGRAHSTFPALQEATHWSGQLALHTPSTSLLGHRQDMIPNTNETHLSHGVIHQLVQWFGKPWAWPSTFPGNVHRNLNS